MENKNSFCWVSENCKTCSFAAMHDFIMKFGEIGFCKSEMKKQLGDKFCEDEWRKWTQLQRRMLSSAINSEIWKN